MEVFFIVALCIGIWLIHWLAANILAFLTQSRVKTRGFFGQEIGHPDTLPDLAKFVGNTSKKAYKKVKIGISNAKVQIVCSQAKVYFLIDSIS